MIRRRARFLQVQQRRPSHPDWHRALRWRRRRRPASLSRRRRRHAKFDSDRGHVTFDSERRGRGPAAGVTRVTVTGTGGRSKPGCRRPGAAGPQGGSGLCRRDWRGSPGRPAATVTLARGDAVGWSGPGPTAAAAAGAESDWHGSTGTAGPGTGRRWPPSLSPGRLIAGSVPMLNRARRPEGY